MAQLALAWCVRNPHVSTVILGASKRPQLEENLAAIDHVSKLTPDVLSRIEAVLGNKPEGPEDFS
jgi:aryl-alcohol dehydrogenase-like predicted oxidoreductase